MRFRLLSIFALFATITFFIGSHFFGNQFIKPDESLYTQISLEMYKTDHWIVPVHYGRPDFVKPPFVYWMELLGFHLFGKRIFSAKFLIWITGILTILCTYGIGLLIFNSETAALGAFFLLANFFFFPYSQADMMDVPLVFFLVLSVYAFILGIKKNRLWFLVSGISLGLNTLTKGPVGILLTLFPLLFYTWAFNEWKIIKTREFAAAFFLAFFFSWIWPLLLFFKGYWKPWFDQFILVQNFGKFSEKSIPFYVLLTGLFGGMIPWSFLLLESLVKGIHSIVTRASKSGKTTDNMTVSKNAIFLLGWTAGIFFIYSLPARKLPHYVLPALPACCLLMASLSEFSLFSIWPTRLLLVIIGIFSFIGIRLTHNLFIQSLLIISGLAVLTAAVLLKNRKRVFWSVLLFGISLSFSPIVIPALSFPHQKKIIQQFSQKKVGVFSPLDTDPKGFELSAAFSTCKTIPCSRKILKDKGILIFPSHDKPRLNRIPLKIIKKWKRWKSGLGLGDILHALWTENTAPLMTTMNAAVLKKKREF